MSAPPTITDAETFVGVQTPDAKPAKRRLAVSSGRDDIDYAVSYWLDRLPDPTPAQRAKVSAIFNRAADRRASEGEDSSPH
ncbi:hypothetical protein [Mycobacterium montefiorense]|uniref:hypothetical protein n=1 Tax=Mycobacterium montefiorense TaxID=154654 RepID=UPI0021DCE1E3|nr:hypothetical protein [Mycobacterium montefiorense]MCV7428157.1 hypothetical protein [Mycobacterium montefiorense]GLE53742.1 hypothetical protein ATCCBAA256_33050 [Mycobacterium montefiorense]